MNSCPEEVIVMIFGFHVEAVDDLKILGNVCKRFKRIASSLYLWYSLFKKLYPKWSYGLKFSYQNHALINWKEFMIKQENIPLEQVYLHSKKYQMQEPFVHDVDPVTCEGMIGVSFYRERDKKRRILFYSYPSFKLVRKYSPSLLTYAERDYQLLNIQSIKYRNELVRLFTIAVLWPVRLDLIDGDPENERANTWDSLLVYRIYNDGFIQCISDCSRLHREFFVGRGAFFFSEENKLTKTSPWFDSDCKNIYVLIFGVNMDLFGYYYIFKLNLNHTMKDPLISQENWFIRRSSTSNLVKDSYLESQVSCMIHFSSPPLHHLICVGNIDSNEISLYDWRSGSKVGGIDWDKEIQPSNFDFLYTLPLPASEQYIASASLARYGPRLVVAGIREPNLFEIRVLDVTHLMQNDWEYCGNLAEKATYDQQWKTIYKYQPGECGDYSAYSIFQTSLYLLTSEGRLLIIDIDTGEVIQKKIIGPGADITVLGGKDVIVTKQHGLLLLK